MPLANAIPRETVEVEGVLPDGTPYKDTYILKGALGFHGARNLVLAGMTVDDLKYFGKKREEGEAETKDVKKPSAGAVFAERDFLIIKTWLVDWSHGVPLTDENIREIPPEHSKVILEKIKSIGEGAQARPFPGDNGDTGISGDHHPGEGNNQLDDLHEDGPGIKGAELGNNMSRSGQAGLLPAG